MRSATKGRIFSIDVLRGFDMLLLPAFLWMSGRRLSVVEVVLWVLLFCPLQFKFGAFETGRHVSNLAFLTLVAWHVWGCFARGRLNKKPICD